MITANPRWFPLFSISVTGFFKNGFHFPFWTRLVFGQLDGKSSYEELKTEIYKQKYKYILKMGDIPLIMCIQHIKINITLFSGFTSLMFF